MTQNKNGVFLALFLWLLYIIDSDAHQEYCDSFGLFIEMEFEKKFNCF
jgi:hypothetical protein